MARKILIVDDEPEIAMPLVHHLEQEGYRLQFAESGRQALSLLETQRPDLLICDLEMPGIGGCQIVEAMATYLNMRELPVILANDKWTTENISYDIGGRVVDCHIGKPYVVREIATYVRRIFKSVDEENDRRRHIDRKRCESGDI